MAQTLERAKMSNIVINTDSRVNGKLSLVLPAHNEEPNIRAVVEEAAQVLPTAFTNYEIVVVNDGSKDRTLEIAQKLAIENHHVQVVNHPINRGYGAALRAASTQPRATTSCLWTRTASSISTIYTISLPM